ncbi:MAG: hypothetical protein JKY84_03125 [Emcibacteraceae bacterium]|nr:hypothetical protein [Emcibacteraceae bacterium]
MAENKLIKKLWLFYDSEKISTESKKYNSLGFFRKAKNLLCTFIFIVILISLITVLANVPEKEAIIVVTMFYIIILPFIYLNHRWAMIGACSFYVLERIGLIIFFPGNPVSKLLYAYIIIALTYNSIKVATKIHNDTKLKSEE